MLFNSYEFIFLFLPITLFVFFLIGKFNCKLAAGWLAAASLFFYGWWNFIFIFLLTASIIFNYAIGIGISKLYQKQHSLKNTLLLIGIIANLGLLSYFKYLNFFLDTINSLFGVGYSVGTIILPLGISFFTFTQIAFLVDVSKGIASEFNIIYYTLFVTYFPHLIAGPVLHHKEMMPQFYNKEIYRFNYQCFSVGLTIFCIGLFKKNMLADEMIQYVRPVFDSAASGKIVSFKESWGAALSYTLQLYFDFSGYSDMAIGLSKMIGVKLPVNFNSPYKASNIIEFWRRWHMTLSRFLRDYLYIPLGGNRRGPVRRYINLMITMILGGMWHGASWNFFVWGGLHGIYLIINHLWHSLRIQFGHDLAKGSIYGQSIGGFITFVAVVFAWVFFRANNLQSGISIAQSMMGLNGFGFSGRFQLSMIAKLLFIAWVMPNTLQIMRHYDPALPNRDMVYGKTAKWLDWHPNLAWLVIIFVLASQSLLQGEKISEFLYFQF